MVVLALFVTGDIGAAPATSKPVVRLYVFDNGTIEGIDPALFGVRKDQVATTDMVASSYLIVHSKGTLLWDAGVVPDELIKAGQTQLKTNSYTALATKTLESQIASVGLATKDITFLALSHFHLDHAGNANAFAGSIWLVQKPEREAMFDPKRTPVQLARYSALAQSSTKILEGDHNVFGDDSVVIRAAYGHTPGHQVLQVNLKTTGTVILAGDLYHFPEQRTLKTTTRGSNVEQLTASRAKIEALLKSTGGQIWLAHDQRNFQRLRKAPAYYD
jgi:N-acyl homoserine lactone hydrolase